jgi:hypothetical protein
MESARHALLVNRLTYDATVTHLDVLRWASEGSARCLGRRDIGAIAVGRQADLAFYTLDELRFSGAGDPIAALVLCGAHRADRVMVGAAGSWRMALRSASMSSACGASTARWPNDFSDDDTFVVGHANGRTNSPSLHAAATGRVDLWLRRHPHRDIAASWAAGRASL